MSPAFTLSNLGKLDYDFVICMGICMCCACLLVSLSRKGHNPRIMGKYRRISHASISIYTFTKPASCVSTMALKIHVSVILIVDDQTTAGISV